ncbi:hypothetical protein SAMN04490356_8533 [Streptomyces melanosporofaciens]|uniref:Uncharacterized protein n=1 Tax=Streptomyces melanosporofaciens TaxID=67327 RepID=A0A1H5AVB2_STRMJ|nr:hypothetical protein SAMN04490356_8533 [Streptomyces melanosporofaciens]
MSSSKYLVIGAGLAGADTLWQLARRGHESPSWSDHTRPPICPGVPQ